jgi:hypothetical protein
VRNKLIGRKLNVFPRNWKVKVKMYLVLTEHHGMKAYEGGSIAPLIFELCTTWRCKISFTSCPFSPGKERRYPWYRRQGGPQSRAERGKEEKNLLPLPGIEHL